MSEGRLLWLAAESPWPINSGGRLRSASLLLGVAPRYDVTLAVLFGRVPADRGLLSGLHWAVANPPSGAKLPTAARLVLQKSPPHLRHFATVQQRRSVARALATGGYDIVVADTPYAIEALPLDVGVPLVLNTHNVEEEVWQTATSELSGGRLLRALDLRFVGRWERKTTRRADGLAACSARDLRLLSTALRPAAARLIVPNCVDVDAIRALPMPQATSEALFVGGLDYGPNREAAGFIVDCLAPLLRSRSTTVTIAGGDREDIPGCHSQERASACSTVLFAGRPPDLTAFYRRAYAVLVPIKSGGGTRLKVLEALAYGRPVISTRKGVEGLDVEPYAHYLPAESPSDFVAQLDRLQDVDVWMRLTTSGRLLVESTYAWPVAQMAFLELIRKTRAHYSAVHTGVSPVE